MQADSILKMNSFFEELLKTPHHPLRGSFPRGGSLVFSIRRIILSLLTDSIYKKSSFIEGF